MSIFFGGPWIGEERGIETHDAAHEHVYEGTRFCVRCGYKKPGGDFSENMAVASIWGEYADERATVFPGGDGKRPADSGKALADIAKRDMRLAVVVP